MRAEGPNCDLTAQGRVFATTHWNVVLAARESASPEGRQALETLCRTYWYPVYAYIRRRGQNPEEAQDLTQEFFVRLLAGNGLSGVDPFKGKFRSFLLASVNHLLSDERDRAQCQKRGGGRPAISFEVRAAEERYRFEPVDEQTPERVFARRWALALVDQVLRLLQEEYAMAGKADVFDGLKEALTGAKGDWDYPAAAEALKLTEGAARTAVHRLRHRFGELFRSAVAQTLSDPAELEDEMHWLLAALSD